MLERGELPLGRALPVTAGQLLIREMILQLKTGRLDASYFQGKFGEDIRVKFGTEFGQLQESGNAVLDNGSIRLTPAGLLQVDRLLPAFFEPQFREVRYT